MNHQLKQLLSRYFDNTIDWDDCQVLLQQLEETDAEVVSAIIDEILSTQKQEGSFPAARQEHIYDRLSEQIQQHQPTADASAPTMRYRYRHWIRIAALWIVACAVSWFIYDTYNTSQKAPEQVALGKSDILLPNDTQAILTLADGETLVLHDSMDGVLAHQGGIAIRRNADGSVWYDTQRAYPAGTEVPLNTFSTPKGHSHQLVLPDGTRVWLNTSSAIRFPVVFSGNERRVVLTGEAYFEVAHNASQPFMVDANGSTIVVSGTHFNVSAYADEPQVTTTLLEGAVHVSMHEHQVTLKPGEQAVANIETGNLQQSNANIQSVMAWKNGYFRFENERIENIIGKVSRWYDIEHVTYRGQFDDRFTGTFQRSKSIAQLLKHLERIAPVKFRIEGKEVVVMK